jgi:hypothetical protein
VKLVFVCPQTNAVFETEAYRVLDNKGVVRDAAGNKILDAKVVLNAPCPFCGEQHVYPASELSCPFGR